MTPMAQLRIDLCNVFDELREGTISTEIARALVDAAGKIIKSCKVEVEYAHLRHERPFIAYLEDVDIAHDRASPPHPCAGLTRKREVDPLAR